MQRRLNFVGTLSDTDCRELKSMAVDYQHSHSWPKSGGLNALVNQMNEMQHISSNATNVYDPIYVVRPNKNSSHYLLEILAAFHKGDKSVSVYYDDNDPDCTPQLRSDYEKSMQTLKDQGMQVYRTVREVHESINE